MGVQKGSDNLSVPDDEQEGTNQVLNVQETSVTCDSKIQEDAKGALNVIDSEDDGVCSPPVAGFADISAEEGFKREKSDEEMRVLEGKVTDKVIDLLKGKLSNYLSSEYIELLVERMRDETGSFTLRNIGLVSSNIARVSSDGEGDVRAFLAKSIEPREIKISQSVTNKFGFEVVTRAMTDVVNHGVETFFNDFWYTFLGGALSGKNAPTNLRDIYTHYMDFSAKLLDDAMHYANLRSEGRGIPVIRPDRVLEFPLFEDQHFFNLIGIEKAYLQVIFEEYIITDILPELIEKQ